MIANTFAMRGEARAVLPMLREQATRRAGEDGVRKVVARRFATFPQPERSEDEWAAWWADYFDTLSDLPLACLEAAMRAFLASPGAEFMPKPWKLRELAEKTPSRALQRYHRAKRALQIVDGEVVQNVEPIRIADPAQADAIQNLMADFKARSLVRKPSPLSPRRCEMPSTAGKPDEGGLTQAMRDLISRRAQQ